MKEIFTLLIGLAVLIAGIPIGNFLAKHTKEELKQGRKWFRIIVVLGLVGGVVGLIMRNDPLFFTSLFIAIVTSRSLVSR
tara:strand:+ start:152 stop:391 length:240 start_codon:yes stop_codon:yes gene_type:complete